MGVWKRKREGTQKEGVHPIAYSLPGRLLAIFLAFLLTVYGAAMAATSLLERQEKNDLLQDYESRLGQLSSQLEAEFERIQSQITYILTRSCVQQMELATSAMEFSEIYENIRQTSELIHALQNSSSLIERAVIFFPRMGKAVSYDSVYTSLSQWDYNFLKEYQAQEGRSVFLTLDGSLYLVSDSMRFSDKTNSAVVSVQLSSKAIAEWCNIFSEGGVACLLSYTGKSGVYAAFGSLDSEQEQEIFLQDAQCLAALQQAGEAGDSQVERVSLPCGNYLRFSHQTGREGMWLSVYVDARHVENAVRPFSVWKLVFTLFLLLEIGAFLYLVRRMVARPIARFAQEVNSLQKERVLLPADRSGGEMDFLYRSFVDMSNQLKTSLEQNYNSKLMAYQSEIRYIQAQIRPHFLYNSFYHLYRMAKMEDNEGVAEMSLRLSSYYRYITRSDQNVVPLQMEYNNAADYVEIQKIRFGDRIAVELEPLPKEYQNLPVPRFVLQPLFENAYNHGVEKITGGIIRMRFLPSKKKLDILVENNGACLQEDLDALTRYLESEEKGGKITALKNVKGRMRLLGGDLNVSRGELGGFCAALTLQLNQEEGELQHADSFVGR